MRRDDESGTTFVEIVFMSLLFTIGVMSLAAAMKAVTKGTLAAREQSRAMSLARDRLEEVKNRGYEDLKYRISKYVYPDRDLASFDPATPLYQPKDAPPYPGTAPTAEEDPWTPEKITMGGITYWRHVVVKFVREGPGGILVQEPEPCTACTPVEPGGTNPGSNLAYIEVAVTWFNQRSGRMKQVRVSTMVANTSITSRARGTISGTIFDDGDGSGAAGALPQPVDADDDPLPGLIVSARNMETDQSFSAKTDVNGRFVLTNLPNGGYLVSVRGYPSYRDSFYTGYDKGEYASLPASPVTVSGGSAVSGVVIYTIKLDTVRLHGRFTNVDGSGTPQTVRVRVNDGASQPLNLTIASKCAPCEFEMPGIAVPAAGSAIYSATIENKTDPANPAVATASLCVDSSTADGSHYYVGWGTFLPGPTGCSGMGPCAAFGTDCTLPAPTAPWLTLTTTGAGVPTAELRVKVVEYYNKTWVAPSVPSLVRVSIRGATTGGGGTLSVDSNGYAVFGPSAGILVPVETPGNLIINAWMTTTGYSTDQFSPGFETNTTDKWDLAEDGGTVFSPLPATGRHTFPLQRVSAVSGTLYDTSGVGYGGQSISIRNADSDWSSVVITNAKGMFRHPEVPVETTTYTVAPIGGADLVSGPVSRSVMVGVHGVEYRLDNTTTPITFVLMPVNGVLRGTVKCCATVVVEPVPGVVVIATTYSGAFPDSLPSAALYSEHTYSTVTMTDGTYSLKVATGVGLYYVYAFTVKAGAFHSSGPVPVAGIPVSPDAEAVYDFTIP